MPFYFFLDPVDNGDFHFYLGHADKIKESFQGSSKERLQCRNKKSFQADTSKPLSCTSEPARDMPKARPFGTRRGGSRK